MLKELSRYEPILNRSSTLNLPNYLSDELEIAKQQLASFTTLEIVNTYGVNMDSWTNFDELVFTIIRR